MINELKILVKVLNENFNVRYYYDPEWMFSTFQRFFPTMESDEIQELISYFLKQLNIENFADVKILNLVSTLNTASEVQMKTVLDNPNIISWKRQQTIGNIEVYKSKVNGATVLAIKPKSGYKAPVGDYVLYFYEKSEEPKLIKFLSSAYDGKIQ